DLDLQDLQGAFRWTHAPHLWAVEDYHLFLAQGAAGENRSQVGTAIPASLAEGAVPNGTARSAWTHFCLYARSALAEQSTPVALSFEDAAAKFQVTNLSFTDEDLDGGEIANSLTWDTPEVLDTLVDFQIYLAGSQVPGDSSKLGVADAISTDFWVSEGTPIANFSQIEVFSRSSLMTQSTPSAVNVTDLDESVSNVRFEDYDLDALDLGGGVNWTAPSPLEGTKTYSVQLVWDQTFEYRSVIGELPVEGDNHLEIPVDTYLGTYPYMYVFTKSSLLEQTTPVGILVSDTAPEITNIEFTDQDLDFGEIGGNLSWTEPANWSLVTHYYIYFAAASSVRRLSAVGNESNTTTTNTTSCDGNVTDCATSTSSTATTSTATATTATSTSISTTSSVTRTETSTSTTSTTITGFTDLTRPATEHDFTGLSLYHTEKVPSSCQAQIPIVGTNADPYLPDANITQSNPIAAANFPRFMRLDGSGQFCNLIVRKTTYIEFDFGTDMLIEKIQTMGRSDIFQWVSKFSLSYTRNGYTWFDLPTVYEVRFAAISELLCRLRHLRPISFALTTVVENIMSPLPFLATKLRLNQLEFFSYPCMRVEIFGCKNADTLGFNALTIPLETDFAAYNRILFFMASALQEQSTPFSYSLQDEDGRVSNLEFIDQDLDFEELGGYVTWTPPPVLTEFIAARANKSLGRERPRRRDF
ncbi:unnamed protein product, partial [Effrenium voratum]